MEEEEEKESEEESEEEEEEEVRNAETYEEFEAMLFECLADPQFKFIILVTPGALVPLRTVESNPRQFWFDVVIRLRLPVSQRDWTLRRAQWSIAEGLGIIDDDDDATRTSVDQSDEDDDYSGVKERDRGVVSEVSYRIYRSLLGRRYLLVLENFSMKVDLSTYLVNIGIPTPDHLNGCKVVFSSPFDRPFVEEDVVLLKLVPKSLNSVAAEVGRRVADEVATSLTAAGGGRGHPHVVLTPDHVIKSFAFLGLFQPFCNVPFSDLVRCMVQEGLLFTRGGGGEPSSRGEASFEMGVALLEELHTHSLLRVKRGDDEIWCRTPVTKRHLPRRRVLASYVWMGISLDKEVVLLIRDKDLMVLPGSATTTFLAMTFDDATGTTDAIPNWSDPSTLPILDVREPTDWSDISTLFVVRDDRERSRKGLLRDVHVPRDFFKNMPGLRVLDLSFTTISSLPDSLFFCLPDLRVLLLRGCKRLETLTAPTTTMTTTTTTSMPVLETLRVLDLSETPICNISDEMILVGMHNLEELLLAHCHSSLTSLPSLRPLENLHVFRLTHTELAGLSDDSFECTPQLRILDLSHNRHMKSLPASLSEASALEELHLKGCEALGEVDFGDGLPMPNLRVFSLSKSPITRLSLRGCSRLEVIELSKLEQLEVLDLSGTMIKHLPAEILNLPRLKRFDLLGAGSLKRVPWEDVERIPEELNLDQCSGMTERLEHRGNGARMFVTDARFFRSLHPNNPFLKKYLSCFHVRISSCFKQVKKMKTQQGAPLPYRDIYSKTKQSSGDFSSLDRHLEIHGGRRFPGDVKGLLSHTDSLSLRDDNSVVTLSDLISDSSNNLKKCQLERCHIMEALFVQTSEDADMLVCLESLLVSKLARLNFAWKEGSFGGKSFENLKHIQIEYCRKLASVFPSKMRGLQSLEVLEIKFCFDLKEVFAARKQVTMVEEDSPVLPRLKTMRLLELPRLESICVEAIHLPASAKLKVRGCWRLRRLPAFTHPNVSSSARLAIDGESKWRNNLMSGT